MRTEDPHSHIITIITIITTIVINHLVIGSLPCTSHRATQGEDLQRVLSLAARGLLPQPPPGCGVENKDNDEDNFNLIVIEMNKKTQLTSSPLPHPEASSSKLSSGGSGLHHRSIAFTTMFLTMVIMMRPRMPQE